MTEPTHKFRETRWWTASCPCGTEERVLATGADLVRLRLGHVEASCLGCGRPATDERLRFRLDR